MITKKIVDYWKLSFIPYFFCLIFVRLRILDVFFKLSDSLFVLISLFISKMNRHPCLNSRFLPSEWNQLKWTAYLFSKTKKDHYWRSVSWFCIASLVPSIRFVTYYSHVLFTITLFSSYSSGIWYRVMYFPYTFVPGVVVARVVVLLGVVVSGVVVLSPTGFYVLL